MSTETRKRVRFKPEVRREQILDEAIQLIGLRGYYGFGIRELAQRCNLTDAGLLHYFGSKNKLLIALLEDRDRRTAEVVTAAAGMRRDGTIPRLTLAQVYGFFHATVAHNTTQPELLRLFSLMQGEALDSAHPAHDYIRVREARILDAFAGLVAPHVEHPRSTALQIVALLKGLAHEWLRTDQGFDMVAEWDRAAARILPPLPESGLTPADRPT